MLLFVDYEHEDRYAAGGVDWLMAARTRITYRLEDLSGLHTMLVRYDRITPALLDRLEPKAIFISGQGTDPSKYRAEDTAALAELVRDGGLPTFGFCGGWQFMATAFGASLESIDVPDDRRDDEIISEWPNGRLAEFGYHPVDVVAEHPLLADLGSQPVFRHAHALHIPDNPTGFATLASTPVTPIQLAVDDDRLMLGTQFHPEYWTDEHPAGRILLESFLEWSGIATGRRDPETPDEPSARGPLAMLRIMVSIETDTKFRRPGIILLVTGVVALLLRLVIRNVPAIGGLLGWICLLGGIFFIVGGVFLLVTKRS